MLRANAIREKLWLPGIYITNDRGGGKENGSMSQIQYIVHNLKAKLTVFAILNLIIRVKSKYQAGKCRDTVRHQLYFSNEP